MATSAQTTINKIPKVDWTGWKSFAVAMLSLAAALALALYSSAAAELGQMWLAGTMAVAALAVAGWVAITIVPKLARRTSLRWLAYHTDYRLPREGAVYLCGVLVLGLAAVNTGNNLLFMMLACMLAGILVSGVLSQMVLSGIELRLELPEHIFAGRPALALAELINHKQTLPSFSLRLVGNKNKLPKGVGSTWSKRKLSGTASAANEILPRPVYFPYIPRHQMVQQNVELTFPGRGIYRQDALGLQTKFPFGFLEKTRRMQSTLQAVVYPSVEPTEQLYEILPLVSGELESYMRGRGHDIYAIRDYQTTDSAHHLDWKASAKTGQLQVREFAREDERRVLLVLDTTLDANKIAPDANAPNAAASSANEQRAKAEAAFERAVSLCASLAWHFHQIDAVLGFRTTGFETPIAPAAEVIYDILGKLATAEPTYSASNRAAAAPSAALATTNALMDELSDSPGLFKIILTCQPQGSIPANIWNSSYVLFVNS
jgi:uncharacterized protein (DUF58 family)